MKSFKEYSIKESILDTSRKILASDIWDFKNNSYILKSDVRNYIFNIIRKFFAKYNINFNVVKRFLIVGGITSYKYKETSDVDVNVGVDVPDNEFDVLVGNVASINEQPIPYTKHPLNYYFTAYDEKLKAGDFIYDIITNVWIKPPQHIKENVDFVSVMTVVQSECRAVDHDEDEFRRDIIDYFILKKDLKEITELDIPESEIKDLLHKKELELFADLDTLKKRYVQIHDFRNKGFQEEEPEDFLVKIDVSLSDRNWTLNNIIYKFLDKYKYLERLKLYLNIHKILIENGKIINNKVEGMFKEVLE